MEHPLFQPKKFTRSSSREVGIRVSFFSVVYFRGTLPTKGWERAPSWGTKKLKSKGFLGESRPQDLHQPHGVRDEPAFGAACVCFFLSRLKALHLDWDSSDTHTHIYIYIYIYRYICMSVCICKTLTPSTNHKKGSSLSLAGRRLRFVVSVASWRNSGGCPVTWSGAAAGRRNPPAQHSPSSRQTTLSCPKPALASPGAESQEPGPPKPREISRARQFSNNLGPRIQTVQRVNPQVSLYKPSNWWFPLRGPKPGFIPRLIPRISRTTTPTTPRHPHPQPVVFHG